MEFNADNSVSRHWKELLAASGQLHGRHWAGSHGRRHSSVPPVHARFALSLGSVLVTLSGTVFCDLVSIGDEMPGRAAALATNLHAFDQSQNHAPKR